MIELSTNTALMLYLGITLGILLGLWTYHHIWGRRKKIDIVERKLCVCEYCHFAYLAAQGKAVTQCPQCHSYNNI